MGADANQFVQQFQAFWPKLDAEVARAGKLAAWIVRLATSSAADQVNADFERKRHHAGRGPCRPYRGHATDRNHGHLEAN